MRSQGGPTGPWPPKFLEHIVIFCFERRYPKQNSVICLKSSISPPGPSQIFGLATLLYDTLHKSQVLYDTLHKSQDLVSCSDELAVHSCPLLRLQL